MALTDDALSLLPPEIPPWRPERPAELATMRRLEGTGWRRAFLWQKQLERSLREYRGWAFERMAGRGADDPFLEIAAGFVERDAMFTREGLGPAGRALGYLFGAVMYDQLHDAEPYRQVLDLGEVDPALRGVPLLYLKVAETPHAPPDLAHASAACWAALRSDGDVRHVLTAKHAVSGKRLGQTIPFSTGMGKLIAYCDSSVDAALVQAPARPSASLAQIPLEEEPAIGDAVQFSGMKTAIASGKVTRTHIFPHDPSAYDPQRVYLDFQGVAGDSGALLRLQSGGAAVGIYTGIKTSGSGTSFGQSQYMKQATELLDIDLYEETHP